MSLIYSFIKIERLPNFVTHVQLNRPKKFNALNIKLWKEIGDAFKMLTEDENTRVIVLSGNGKNFCAGIDLYDSQKLFNNPEMDDLDNARKSRKIRNTILELQSYFNVIEECLKPVIVVVHGLCIGAGVDMITACDIRFATTDAIFSVKEVDIGMAADVGTLNRLPKIVGNEGWIKEISFTGKNFTSDEGYKNGLIGHIYEDKETCLNKAIQLAQIIGEKSPVAVQGTKAILNYARDHTVKESLDYVANWNSSQLITNDLIESVGAFITKSGKPKYSKL
ncbi:Delta(3,5)-Delta(2,4)-dienoyl-CoA isomerase, mitochondrial [Strongyloides ratti]|uniref:Delta(3,5)-Delta(2,4)-dienoyl-CoA isomerase, mitochondrial n=1 Tax=Strongyloides ratti TaxID=34506 RepID=A0A090LNE6_STRRB|nr:Delta(3,5)-Delta(2,4)-dienoyl-CoA isomerase, mitochondrial [Strongyloides ratti]CEF71251.1 Delta(3,5)-Delta(2,4)-dienoyl-CoA isomerase, mitochondrial [Strongyloides ratti]